MNPMKTATKIDAGQVRENLQRFIGPLAVALVIIIGMFWILHSLISHGKGLGQKADNMQTIDFVRLNRAFELETKVRTPPKMPDKPEPAPAAPSQQMQAVSAPTPSALNISNMSIENTTSVKAGFGLSTGDGEYLPIVKVAPMYPPGAQARGQEGWVLLEFTVTESGSVIDASVVESQPPGVFDEAAKRAVLKFKYKPRVENGKPVAAHHIQHLISFKMDKK
jgi:protein TonB